MDPTVTNPADPIDAGGEPAGVWLRRNAVNLVLGAATVGLVLYYLNPLDVVLAAAGLTAIIFIHELGHFAAAKFCKVRVDTFSIGFGPAIPGCQFQYGETTYKLAVVPLGGFVKMLGQEDGVVDGEPDNDPRSYKNQTVPERMLIISAGVVMNLLLGCLLFVVVYMHGLEEKPAEIAYLEPGGAAWQQGLHSGTEIKALGGRQNPWFDDIRPSVWATQQGEQLPMVIEYKGERREIGAEPIAEEGAPYPVLGIAPPEALTLPRDRPGAMPPFVPGSAAVAATAPDGPSGFRHGDRIVGMSDPDAPGRAVTPLVPARADDPPGDVYVFFKRMARLAAEPVTLHVVRAGDATETPVPVRVPPAFRRETGLRMRMGEVTATRIGSPAAKAGVQPKDRIVEVEVRDGDKTTVFGSPTNPLDPLRLPTELNRWADRTAGPKAVKLTVLREVDHTEKRVAMVLEWDAVGQFDLAVLRSASNNTPLPVNGLGLAYRVQAVVDAVAANSPAAAAGLQPGDAVEAVRFKMRGHDGKEQTGPWETLKPHQWAAADALVQVPAAVGVEMRVVRGGQKLDPVTLAPADDKEFPAEGRGIDLTVATRVQKADSIGDALAMGFHRTTRSIRGIYMNLYAMVFGRMSAVQTLSGPITLARASYMLAGESTWRLLLLLALISINLAVVNFLPIPVLDGGHMVFLTYELFRGKPAPERVQVWLTIFGLVCVGCLMLFVVGLDVYRLVVMWIGRI